LEGEKKKGRDPEGSRPMTHPPPRGGRLQEIFREGRAPAKWRAFPTATSEGWKGSTIKATGYSILEEGSEGAKVSMPLTLKVLRVPSTMGHSMRSPFLKEPSTTIATMTAELVETLKEPLIEANMGPFGGKKQRFIYR